MAAVRGGAGRRGGEAHPTTAAHVHTATPSARVHGPTPLVRGGVRDVVCGAAVAGARQCGPATTHRTQPAGAREQATALPSTDQAHSVPPMAARSSSRRSSRRCVGPPLSTPPTPIPPTRHTAEPLRPSMSVRRPSMAASAAESAGHWPRGCCPSPAASGGWHTRCVSRGAWPCLHHIAPRPSPATRSAPPAIASDPACCVHVPFEWAGGPDPERLWRSASRGWLWRC